MFRAVVFCMLLSAPVFAAPPTLVVPEKVFGEEGEYIWFKVQTDSKWVEFEGADKLTFFPSAKLKDPTETGVWGAAGTYTITVRVGNTEAPAKATVTVVIVKKGIIPPDPKPKPDPLPDGELGLVKASREGAAASQGTVAQRAALAKANRSQASKVAAGAYSSASAVLEGWRAGNGAAVAPDAAKWKPWADATASRLELLYKDGRVRTNAQWSAAFNEIAQGLE